jgi:hypothetical protein
VRWLVQISGSRRNRRRRLKRIYGLVLIVFKDRKIVFTEICNRLPLPVGDHHVSTTRPVVTLIEEFAEAGGVCSSRFADLLGFSTARCCKFLLTVPFAGEYFALQRG